MMVFLARMPYPPAEARTLPLPWGGVGLARGASASGEKIEKPSTFVQLSPIKGLLEGHNSLGPCGETRLNPYVPPYVPKVHFWAIKRMN